MLEDFANALLDKTISDLIPEHVDVIVQGVFGDDPEAITDDGASTQEISFQGITDEMVME